LTGDNEIEGGMRVGGIVGGGFCYIIDCSARADVTLLGDGAGAAGVLAGGMETSDIVDCSATGSVTAAGTGNMGIGGLAGCAQDSERVLRCRSDVTIAVGENNILIGGLLGYAGSTGDSATLVSDCSVTAAITAADSAERIGGIVGGGFFAQMYSMYYPEPTAVRAEDCQTSGEIKGGRIVGTVLGYAYNNSFEENCTSDMKVDGDANAEKIGATLAEVGLDELR
jgi:hypothetical protein